MVGSPSPAPAVSAVDVEDGGHEDGVADGEDGEADEDAARAARGRRVAAGLQAGAVRAAVAQAEAARRLAPLAAPLADPARHAAERVGRAEEGPRREEGLQPRRGCARFGISPRLAVNLLEDVTVETRNMSTFCTAWDMISYGQLEVKFILIQTLT